MKTNVDRISAQLKEWFNNKELLELNIGYNSNGVLEFSGKAYQEPTFEYQWMYMEDGRYKVTSCHYIDTPIKCLGQTNWKRLDESKRIKKCQ